MCISWKYIQRIIIFDILPKFLLIHWLLIYLFLKLTTLVLDAYFIFYNKYSIQSIFNSKDYQISSKETMNLFCEDIEKHIKCRLCQKIHKKIIKEFQTTHKQPI